MQVRKVCAYIPCIFFLLVLLNLTCKFTARNVSLTFPGPSLPKHPTPHAISAPLHFRTYLRCAPQSLSKHMRCLPPWTHSPNIPHPMQPLQPSIPPHAPEVCSSKPANVFCTASAAALVACSSCARSSSSCVLFLLRPPPFLATFSSCVLTRVLAAPSPPPATSPASLRRLFSFLRAACVRVSVYVQHEVLRPNPVQARKFKVATLHPPPPPIILLTCGSFKLARPMSGSKFRSFNPREIQSDGRRG